MIQTLVGICIVFSAFSALASFFALLILWEQKDKDS